MQHRNPLLELISQGEHQEQDFKYKIQDPEKLARSVSAFANTDGGRLLIGVRDDGHISGVRSEEEIFQMEQAARQWCRPASDVDFETFSVEGRTVVIAAIPRARQRPVCALEEGGRKRAYVRVKDENIVASPLHMEIWKQEKASTVIMTYSDDYARLFRVVAEHPGETINRLVRLSGLSRYRVVRMLAGLVRYRLVEMRYEDGKWTLRPSAERSEEG